MPRKKSFDIFLKEAGEDKPSIVAYASTFHREPDSYGDIVAKGAFIDSLKKWEESGHSIPLLYGHRLDDPMMNLGKVMKAEEDDNGLLVSAEFDMENPNAVKAYRDVKSGTLSKLSFAFDVLDFGYVKLESGADACELRKLEIYEVSLVPIPANQHAEVVDVKAGRRNSAADAGVIQQCIDLLSGLISAEDGEEGSGKDPEGGKAHDAEDQKQGNSEMLETLKRIKKLLGE